ncbi:MAG: hypothetical protein ACREIV_10430 [Planctomycetaceae bacterium]
MGYHPPPLPGLRKFAPPNAEVIFSVILSRKREFHPMEAADAA